MKNIKILLFGDIFGKLGRQGIAKILPKLKKQYQPDLSIANVENLAHGRGITPSTIKELQKTGLDFFTSGNHVFDKPQANDILEKKNPLVIRPANYPAKTPGQGEKILNLGGNKLLVVNLMGRVFFDENFNCPFATIDQVLEKYQGENLAGIIIDFHAEATSEKKALGFYLDGKVSAVLGTHTHVQTSDERILKNGTAYISDLGMIGAQNSVIGLDKDIIISNFKSEINRSAPVPESGDCLVNGVYLEINPKTQKAIKIKRINEVINSE